MREFDELIKYTEMYGKGALREICPDIPDSLFDFLYYSPVPASGLIYFDPDKRFCLRPAHSSALGVSSFSNQTEWRLPLRKLWIWLWRLFRRRGRRGTKATYLHAWFHQIMQGLLQNCLRFRFIFYNKGERSPIIAVKTVLKVSDSRIMVFGKRPGLYHRYGNSKAGMPGITIGEK